MRGLLTPKLCFVISKVVGFCLLFAFWIESGEITGFFPFLFLIVMSLLRWRIQKLKLTVFIDFFVSVAWIVEWDYTYIILILVLFEAMYLGFYFSAFSISYAFYKSDFELITLFVFSALCGLFLNCWESERRHRQLLRDEEAGRYYELEGLQDELVNALAQIEHMTTVAERARIARDIHDNAGHEIVAAHVSLQTVRAMIDTDNSEFLELYDASLERLNSGVNKIREAVHNLSTVNTMGVERLREKCKNYPTCEISFNVYGDTTQLPVYIWNVLESCLSEALTNIVRHSRATWITVELDVTLHIVRLCVENDGIIPDSNVYGGGLRNLRYRTGAIGGSLSLNKGEVFRMVCVIPVRNDVFKV